MHHSGTFERVEGAIHRSNVREAVHGHFVHAGTHVHICGGEHPLSIWYSQGGRGEPTNETKNLWSDLTIRNRRFPREVVNYEGKVDKILSRNVIMKMVQRKIREKLEELNK